MGKVKKILYSKQLNANVPTFYNDKMSCEVCEDFHIHYKNMRLNFGQNEWDFFCKTIIAAHNEWLIKKDELKQKIVNKDFKTKYLPSAQNITNNCENLDNIKYDIEESEYDMFDTIHIHYRNFRLELDHKEFIEFANGINEALKKIK